MGLKEKEIEKLYYSIGEVSVMLSLTASQIRYWENEFDNLKLKKDRKGNRLFTKDDIETLKAIQHLLREKGYTIEGARAHFKAAGKMSKQNFQVLDKLKEVKKFLEELKGQI